MTNIVVGDVFSKIIEEVVSASLNDFEESGVGQQALQELQTEWQQKLSGYGVAQMPWDPKPAPPPVQQPASSPQNLQSSNQNAHANPLTQYAAQPTSLANGTQRIKAEPGAESQFYGLPQPNGYAQNGMGPAVAQQRAATLMQQQFGNQATASINAMQQRAGGLALPGQKKPHGLQLPQQGQLQQSQPQNPQQQFTTQQYQQDMQHQQQQQQQQQNPRIKQENNSPQLSQGQFQQRPQHLQQRQPNQYDGADEALEDWQAYIAQRRAATADNTAHADRVMRDQVAQLSAYLENGLMIPLDQQKSNKRRNVASTPATSRFSSAAHTNVDASIPQLDGDVATGEEKPDIKDEDDEDAINSDLDDPDEENAGAEDEDDDKGDSILCTYDKVNRIKTQRVKNKWKCTLKDGVLKTNNKEYLFHKAQGEFEW